MKFQNTHFEHFNIHSFRIQLGHILSVSLSMHSGGDWGVEMREERSCKSEEKVEKHPQSYKNE